MIERHIWRKGAQENTSNMDISEHLVAAGSSYVCVFRISDNCFLNIRDSLFEKDKKYVQFKYKEHVFHLSAHSFVAFLAALNNPATTKTHLNTTTWVEKLPTGVLLKRFGAKTLLTYDEIRTLKEQSSDIQAVLNSNQSLTQMADSMKYNADSDGFVTDAALSDHSDDETEDEVDEDAGDVSEIDSDVSDMCNDIDLDETCRNDVNEASSHNDLSKVKRSVRRQVSMKNAPSMDDDEPLPKVTKNEDDKSSKDKQCTTANTCNDDAPIAIANKGGNKKGSTIQSTTNVDLKNNDGNSKDKQSTADAPPSTADAIDKKKITKGSQIKVKDEPSDDKGNKDKQSTTNDASANDAEDDPSDGKGSKDKQSTTNAASSDEHVDDEKDENEQSNDEAAPAIANNVKVAPADEHDAGKNKDKQSTVNDALDDVIDDGAKGSFVLLSDVNVGPIKKDVKFEAADGDDWGKSLSGCNENARPSFYDSDDDVMGDEAIARYDVIAKNDEATISKMYEGIAEPTALVIDEK